MADEKNKKKIINSDNSDDENSGDAVSENSVDAVSENLGDAVSEQTELSLILDKLSLEPKKEKKKLLVLSLSGLLLHRVHKKNIRKTLKNRSADASCGPNLLYKRPFAREFIKFCLERFEVGIWSSACERNVDIVLNIVLKNLEDKLLFVWDQAECTNSGYKALENSDKPLFFKNLSKVFQCFKGFSALNTIFVDDEPYKALRNPDNTGLFPLTYDPLNSKDNFLDPEGEFCSYLDGLARSSNVQAYIKEHPFGQPSIDSSHPVWYFYSKVASIVS